jgi:hypothetical protein
VSWRCSGENPHLFSQLLAPRLVFPPGPGVEFNNPTPKQVASLDARHGLVVTLFSF